MIQAFIYKYSKFHEDILKNKKVMAFLLPKKYLGTRDRVHGLIEYTMQNLLRKFWKNTVFVPLEKAITFLFIKIF